MNMNNAQKGLTLFEERFHQTLRIGDIKGEIPRNWAHAILRKRWGHKVELNPGAGISLNGAGRAEALNLMNQLENEE